MKLLLINPNISESVSELIRGEARRSASPGTEIEVLTAPFGVAYIETRFEALIGAYAVAQLAAEHHERADAIVVAAFGDPGLAGLREASPVPVTGLTEAALASAHLLGHRFSIIAISQRIQAWYREMVESYGLGRPAGQHPRAGPAARQHRRRPGGSRAGAQGAGRARRAGGRRRSDRAGRRAAGRPGPLAQGPTAGAGGGRRVERRAPRRNPGGAATGTRARWAASRRPRSNPIAVCLRRCRRCWPGPLVPDAARRRSFTHGDHFHAILHPHERRRGRRRRTHQGAMEDLPDDAVPHLDQLHRPRLAVGGDAADRQGIRHRPGGAGPAAVSPSSGPTPSCRSPAACWPTASARAS